MRIIRTIDLNREKARRSYFEFFQQAWHILEPKRELVLNWHMEYLCNLLQEEVERISRGEEKEHDFVINIPFRSLKSTLLTKMLHPWVWVNYPWMRIQSASYGANLSLRDALASRKVIESPWYQRRFGDSFKLQTTREKGDTRLKDTTAFYENSEGGFRFATSVGATSTGFGGQLNLLDDPLKASDAESPAARKKASEWLRETWFSRTDDFLIDTFFTFMQRLHEEDPTGALLEMDADREQADKKFLHINLPAKDEGNVKPEHLAENYQDRLFFKERFSQKVLDDLLDKIGVRAFNAQVQQQPSMKGGNLFKRIWFRKIKREYIPKDRMIARRATFWDTAFTEDEKNAACAYVEVWLDFDFNVYVMDFGYDWLDTPTQLTYIRKHNAPHYIEAKATGKSDAELLRTKGITCIEVEVPGNAGDKWYRANLVAPHVQAGQVYVLDRLYEQLLTDQRQGLLRYPEGSHKDVGDAFVMALTEMLGQAKVWSGEDFNDIFGDSSHDY